MFEIKRCDIEGETRILKSLEETSKGNDTIKNRKSIFA